MPVANHGNFDLVIESDSRVVSAQCAAHLRERLPETKVVNTTGIEGIFELRFRIESVTFLNSSLVSIIMKTTGTTFLLEKVKMRGTTPVVIPSGSQETRLNFALTIQGTLQLSNSDSILKIGFRQNPVQSFALEEETYLNSDGIRFYMASIYEAGDTQEKLQAAALRIVNDELKQGISQSIILAGAIPLVPSNSTYTVRRFITRPKSVSALCNVRGVLGTESLITNTLLASDSDGFVERIGVCINNACFLRDFLRASIMPGFGIFSGFVSTHPFSWSGAFPVRITGITSPTLERLTGGIDNTGRVHLVGTLSSPSGALTLRVDFDFSFTLAASFSADGQSIVITSTGGTMRVVKKDVVVPPWLYAIGFVFGGVPLTLYLAAVDALAGTILQETPLLNPIPATPPVRAGSLSSMLTPAPIVIPLPPRNSAPLVSIISNVNTSQPAALLSTLTTGGITLPDGFRQNDVIVDMI